MVTFIDIAVINEFEDRYRELFSDLEIRITYEKSPSKGWIGPYFKDTPVEYQKERVLFTADRTAWIQNWIKASHKKKRNETVFINLKDYYKERFYSYREFAKGESAIEWITQNINPEKNVIMLHPLHKYVMWYSKSSKWQKGIAPWIHL